MPLLAEQRSATKAIGIKLARRGCSSYDIFFPNKQAAVESGIEADTGGSRRSEA